VELAQSLPQFEAKQAQILAIAFQNVSEAQLTVDETKVTYPILADSDHAVAEAYQVYNLLGDGVATPAIFIINPQGQISWSYIGKDLADRPGHDTILAQLP